MTEKTSLRVTIGIPTYNRANSYLKFALKSVLDQKYDNLEIVLSDNCSTDHTQSLVKDMNDGRIQYFRQPRNIPANDNFNFCLEQATGDYFLLLHDDDTIASDFVDTCMRQAEGDPNFGVILTGNRRIDSRGDIINENLNKVKGLSTDDFFLGWFTGRIALYMCSTLYNTRELKKLGGFSSPKALFQDVVATVQLAANCGRLDISDIKATFRMHDANRGKAVEVVDWSMDSRYLLDLICRLSGEKRSQVRHLGLHFLSLKNYDKAANIDNPLKRWKMYHHVYKRFEGTRPPMRKFKRYEVNAVKRLVKR